MALVKGTKVIGLVALNRIRSGKANSYVAQYDETVLYQAKGPYYMYFNGAR